MHKFYANLHIGAALYRNNRGDDDLHEWGLLQMNWDQLRFFLELSRSGTRVAAAARLGVNQTTVSRRIQTLEKQLGVPLFTRQHGNYVLTEEGRLLLPRAEQIETGFLDIEQTSAKDSLVSGAVRIGATEGHGTVILAPLLAELSQHHPNLRIDLLAVPRLVNLSRREADIVVTLERPSRGPYIMARLTDYALALYAAPDYLKEHPPIKSKDDLAHHKFVSYIDDLLFSNELHYLSDLCNPDQVAVRSTSILAQQQAVIHGAGLAILPLFIAQDHPGLKRVLHDQVELIRTFWIMMPREVKDLSRMRLTWDFLRASAEHAQSRLLGQSFVTTA